MDNEQGLPSSENMSWAVYERLCTSLTSSRNDTEFHRSAEDQHIYERSTAGHGQSDTCLCPSLARFSPAVCIAVSSGHNSRIQHLNSALVRKNQVMGSFCSCPSSIHLTESDGYSLQSGTAILTWIRRSNCFFLKSPLCPGILYLKRDFITMIFIYKDRWFEKWPK